MKDAKSISDAPLTVGILHVGEMGAALARVLRGWGVRVVSCAEGRSRRTWERCRDEQVELLDSVPQVIRKSDLVVSVVPPDAAMQTAELFCGCESPGGAIYVDANSIGPELAQEIAGKVEARGHGFVDAAINGLARNLTTSATMFLSGVRAEQVAMLFGPPVRCRVLGDAPGAASAMKMLLSGVSKGVCALYCELLLLAEQSEMTGEFESAVGAIYPEIASLATRMLPTYSRHAARRAVEIGQLRDTARAAGLQTPVLRAVGVHHRCLAAHLAKHPLHDAATIRALLDHLRQTDFLAAPALGRAAHHSNLGQQGACHGQ